MHHLRALLLILFAATCFQGYALDSKPIVLNPTTGNFRNLPAGDRLSIPTAAGGYLVTVEPGVQTATRVTSVPVLTGNDTFAMLGVVQTFTAPQAIQATNGITVTAASTQDAVRIAGRVGGTSSFIQIITTAALGASRTFTLPDANMTITGGGTLALGGFTATVPATDTVAMLGVANAFSAINNFANATAASSMTAGAVTIGNGTAVTNTAIGGGKIYTGQYLQAGTPAAGTNPGVIININNSGNGASNPDLAILNSGSSANSRCGFLLASHPTDYTQLFCNVAVWGASSSGSLYGGTTDAGKVAFYAQGASVTRMLLGCYANSPLDMMTNNVVSLSISATGIVSLPGTTDSTTTTTGAQTIAGGLGVAKNAYALTWNSTTGTITTSQPAFSATQTWNAGGVLFTGIKSNITNTASAASSLLIDLQVGGTSRFSVDKQGCLLLSSDTAAPPAGSSAGTFRINPGAHLAMTAGTEQSDILFNLGRTAQFSTGAITTQRAFVITAPTYSFVGASTITNAATVSIAGAPGAGANATITNGYALWVLAGTTRLDGALEVSSTTLIKSNTALSNGAGAGAGTITNAPAAGNPTKWIPINDNGTTRYIPAW